MINTINITNNLDSYDEIIKEYFIWLCGKVNVSYKLYGIIMKLLFDTIFDVKLPMDTNRFIDGIQLRELFLTENHYLNNTFFENIINDRPCSVLEVLIALAIRCDENIMYDGEIGDRSYKWFWIMIENLGLDILDVFIDEEIYSELYLKVLNFIDRNYEKNGQGGLFPLKNPKKDQRKVEIWYQMNEFLIENFDL